MVCIMVMRRESSCGEVRSGQRWQFMMKGAFVHVPICHCKPMR